MATSSFVNTPDVFLASLMPPTAWTDHAFQEHAFQEVEQGLLPAELESECDPCPQVDVAAVCQPMDPAMREQVLLQHISIVRFVARRIHERLPQHVEFEDLVSAGIVGLIDAFQKFDASKNVQFRSYAQFRIRGAILDSLRTLDWGPRDLRRKGRGIEAAIQKLTASLGRRPTENEVSSELRMPLVAYQQLLGELKGLEITSLNEARSEDSPEEELASVPADSQQDPLLLCMKREMAERLTSLVATLPERDGRILSMYYVEEMTMKEIGAVLGVVESRVSQIHSSVLAVLRARFARGSRAALPMRKKTFSSKPAVPAALLPKRQSSLATAGHRPAAGR
ncbi:MAG: sigma-70 family RNA polymerase sigma factor [Acidobacteriaceae bacterium]